MAERTDLLDLKDIQGNILRPYGFRHGGYLFVAVGKRPGDAAAARNWLGGLQVTTAAPWPPNGKLDVALNVAVSCAGLRALGAPEACLATFGLAFGDGMKARATYIGDIGPSAPDQWEKGLRGEAHVVVLVHARTAALAHGRMQELREGVAAPGSGVGIVHDLECHDLDGQREHFGFSDGFGQPAVEGSGHEHLPGQGVPCRGGGWRPVKAGEFILGYEDEDQVRPEMPAPPLGANGSYLVLRKLEQHVGRYRSWIKAMAKDFHITNESGQAWPERVGALLVGRWQDGTPLELSPHAPAPTIARDRSSINDFRYGGDPTGERCPLGAHIRRTNPREDLDEKGRLSARRRMIRRGMPYGQRLPEGKPDDGKSRGLVFACYVASIERQFEEVQRGWCNDGDDFGLGLDRDPIAGRPWVEGEARNKVNTGGRAPHFFVQERDPIVQTRGGEYLFVPGVAALRAIAEGVWGDPDA